MRARPATAMSLRSGANACSLYFLRGMLSLTTRSSNGDCFATSV
jgi:hypothetical protein